MSILTKEVQNNFIDKNFNKPVIYFSNIGRLIGYIETQKGYCNAIAFGFGHKEQIVYIDAGLKLTFVEPDNILFEEINNLLSLNGNPELKNYLFQDFKDNILFNTTGLNYIKNHSQHLFNKIVKIDNDIVRMVGYRSDDYGNSYICFNIKNEKKYFDSLCRIKEDKMSEQLNSHIENTIKKSENLIFEK